MPEIHSRREFLHWAGGCGLALVTSSLSARELLRVPLTPDEVKRRIRGPVLTVPTPFTRDFQVDHAGVRKMLNLGLAQQVDVYELTAGNSQYAVLSGAEIRELARTVVDGVAHRGIVIAATGAWWTGQAVEYARYAESIGADAVQVLLPPGSASGYVRHFQALASATKLPLILQGQLSFDLLEELVRIPAIIGMKEDGDEPYYADVTRKFGQRLVVFCGGQKRRYLAAGHAHGSPAWFSFFITFAPQVAVEFRQAIDANDLAAAHRIVERYERPVFDFCTAGPRSFHAYWRGLLEVFGVARRYVRPPEDSCNDDDLQRIRELCMRIGLLPPAPKEPAG